MSTVRVHRVIIYDHQLRGDRVSWLRNAMPAWLDSVPATAPRLVPSANLWWVCRFCGTRGDVGYNNSLTRESSRSTRSAGALEAGKLARALVYIHGAARPTTGRRWN